MSALPAAITEWQAAHPDQSWVPSSVIALACVQDVEFRRANVLYSLAAKVPLASLDSIAADPPPAASRWLAEVARIVKAGDLSRRIRIVIAEDGTLSVAHRAASLVGADLAAARALNLTDVPIRLHYPVLSTRRDEWRIRLEILEDPGSWWTRVT